jgi:hypothetical protein
MMDASTSELLRGSLRAVLSERSDRPLTGRLADLGWDDVLADDAPGALRLLFETKGEVLASDDVLGPLLARTIADAAPTASVPTAATVVLPSSLHADRPSARVDGDGLVVEGVALRTPGPGAPMIVPVANDDGVRLALTGGGEPVGEGFGGFDPDLGLICVRGRVAASSVTWIEGPDATCAWEAAVGCGRWALAAELVGIARWVVADAVAYTLERRQYGRAIGSFQALQHRLASAHASVVGASHVVAEAATTGSPWVALVAKSLAGHAAEDACTQAQQSYGAIGFTWEHGFHRSLRRVYALDRLLGGWRDLEAEIGRRLEETRLVPQIGAL